MEKNPVRWWDIPAVLLLLAALAVAAIRLRITEWTSNLGAVEMLALLGGVLGMALGYSRLKRSWVYILAFIYSGFFLPLQILLTFEKGAEPVLDKITNLYARLYWSFADFLQNKPVQDSLLFVTVVAIIFWLLAMMAGYQLTRWGKPWAPLIVLGLALLIIDFYTPYTENRDRYSGIFVFLILFLLARVYYMRSRRTWLENGATVDPEVGFDMSRSVAVAGLALVMVAWNVPTFVEALTPGTELQKELAKQWESLRDRLQNAVAGLQSKAIATSDYFGTDLNLGVGGTRDEELVFSVEVPNPVPTGVRFYWRARSYDTYTAGQWSSTLDRSQVVAANAWPFLYPDWKGRKVVDITFNAWKSQIRNLYLPSLPLSIARNTEVIGAVNADSTFDFIGALASNPLKAGDYFKARVWMSAPAIQDLKASNAQYPEEIKKAYLQLPQNFSRRIRSLALQLTARATNQYDKVMAITTWLRDNITYKDIIDTPPQGRDPIEWFLFDYRQGFCNYYASAEVLLLRSVGIPARMTVGYAPGEFDEGKFSYQVLRRDSHAWPEVYFEGYGWVEFEPTASQPATSLIERVSEEQNGTQSLDDANALPPLGGRGEEREGETDSESNAGASNSISPWLTIGLPVGLGLLLLGLLFWLGRTGRLAFLRIPLPVVLEQNLQKRGWSTPGWLRIWATLTRLTPIERLYFRLGWTLGLLGRKTVYSHTPSERVAEISKALPEAQKPLADFLMEYEHAVYSPYPYSIDKARTASNQVWRQALRAFFQRLTRA